MNFTILLRFVLNWWRGSLGTKFIKHQHSGIHVDKSSGKGKIWLNNPSYIRVEFLFVSDKNYPAYLQNAM